jgi:hypothetical protein
MSLDIHEELDRVILRTRWIKWSMRTYQPGDYDVPDGRHLRLEKRLEDAKPTWEQRQAEPEFWDETFDILF